MTYIVGAAFGGTRSGVTLVLAGVAVTSLVTAVQTFILQRNSEVVREVYSWILGRLSTAALGRRPDGRCRTSSSPRSCCSLHRRHLDLLRVGDDEASTLGAPVARVRLVVVIAATLGTAAVVVGERADRVRRDRRPAPRSGCSPGRATAACCRCRCCSARRS